MKSVKRALSAMVVLAIICAMFVMPVNADAEEIVLGNSSFTWSHNGSKNNANAYDGTYTKFEGGGATITATKTFDVESDVGTCHFCRICY